MADPRAASQCITATATTGTAPVALGTARATRSRAPDEFGARWHHHARAGRGIPGIAKASRFPRSQNQAPAPNTNCGSAAARASLRASRATPASQRNAGLGTTLMTTATMGVLFAGGAGPAVRCRTASHPAATGCKRSSGPFLSHGGAFLVTGCPNGCSVEVPQKICQQRRRSEQARRYEERHRNPIVLLHSAPRGNPSA